MKAVRVYPPATIANLVCGFDVLGMAIDAPCDMMVCRTSDTPGLRIIHTDAYALPTVPENNVAGVALLAMMEELPADTGFDLLIHKSIKPGSGLGSSAASAAGAVVAANALLEQPFSKEDLVRFAMFGEKLATGVKHADNIAPCIYGGITLIRSIFPLDIISLPAPDLFVTVVHPQIEVKTADARQILRKEVQLKQAIRQWGNIAGLVAGILQQDHALIGRSLEDVLIEPVRSILIPGFDQLKQRCLNAGALGGGISGSGPSVFMLSETAACADSVAGIMQKTYDDMDVTANVYVTKIAKQGVRIELIESV